jgi:outer membrane protein
MWWCPILLVLFCCSPFRNTASCEEPITLRDTIREALRVDLQIKISREESAAAIADRKVQRSKFFPTLSALYQYRRNDDQRIDVSQFGFPRPRNEFTLGAKFSQPIFTGFALTNQYKVAKIGVEVADLNEKLRRQDVILAAKDVYFSLLKTQKLVDVGKQTVKQIEAQSEVAENFYQVGMTPLNDFLEVEVTLANVKQLLIVAENDMATAEANFNTLLRRPVNKPILIEDIQIYDPLNKDLEYFLQASLNNRLEMKLADLEIQVSERELKVAKKDYYPSVTLEGSYSQWGADWDARKGYEDFDDDAYSWNISAVAQWDFWTWGRTYYSVESQLRKTYQAEHRKKEVTDLILLEVKQAYLKVLESLKNIVTIEKAIEQAKENLRINQEQYKQQVATSTNVLDAQTLLTRTMANYYTALYDYKIAKAFLFRAAGLPETIEEGIK